MSNRDRVSSETAVDDRRATDERGGVVSNRWRSLRAFTDARIGLGRAGISLPSQRLLDFQLAHAQAIDAVQLPLDVDGVCRALADADLQSAIGRPPHVLHTQASDRTTFLQRPDLGRVLDEDSRARLAPADDTPVAEHDLAVVIVDGLSARAIHDHAVNFVAALSRALVEDGADPWTVAPLTVVQQGRVAIGDDIAPRLNARAVLVLIGERPGLSSPDSLGLYLTWAPGPETTDADRNCISNVRPAGLTPDKAVERLLYLLREARHLELTGVGLKDRSDDAVIDQGTAEPSNFLIS